VFRPPDIELVQKEAQEPQSLLLQLKFRSSNKRTLDFPALFEQALGNNHHKNYQVIPAGSRDPGAMDGFLR